MLWGLKSGTGRFGFRISREPDPPRDDPCVDRSQRATRHVSQRGRRDQRVYVFADETVGFPARAALWNGARPMPPHSDTSGIRDRGFDDCLWSGGVAHCLRRRDSEPAIRLTTFRARQSGRRTATRADACCRWRRFRTGRIAPSGQRPRNGPSDASQLGSPGHRVGRGRTLGN